jgi:hypothetical protein
MKINDYEKKTLDLGNVINKCLTPVALLMIYCVIFFSCDKDYSIERVTEPGAEFRTM